MYKLCKSCAYYWKSQGLTGGVRGKPFALLFISVANSALSFPFYNFHHIEHPFYHRYQQYCHYRSSSLIKALFCSYSSVVNWLWIGIPKYLYGVCMYIDNDSLIYVNCVCRATMGTWLRLHSNDFYLKVILIWLTCCAF